MFEEVICRSCDGNGCIRCDGNGIRYVEIDDPTLALQDEIAELKRQLDIAKEALKFGFIMIAEIHSQKQMWPAEIDGFEERARKALKELESAGE